MLSCPDPCISSRILYANMTRVIPRDMCIHLGCRLMSSELMLAVLKASFVSHQQQCPFIEPSANSFAFQMTKSPLPFTERRKKNPSVCCIINSYQEMHVIGWEVSKFLPKLKTVNVYFSWVSSPTCWCCRTTTPITPKHWTFQLKLKGIEHSEGARLGYPFSLPQIKASSCLCDHTEMTLF